MYHKHVIFLVFLNIIIIIIIMIIIIIIIIIIIVIIVIITLFESQIILAEHECRTELHKSLVTMPLFEMYNLVS